MNLDQLTPDEQAMLTHKLYSAGHKLAEVGHTLGGVALTLHVADPLRDVLFDRLRQPYVDAMREAHRLADAVLTGSI